MAHFAIARYLPNGVLDTTFAAGGILRIASPDFPGGTPHTVAVKCGTQGGITFAGAFARHFAIARVRVDGTLDAQFGNSGVKVSQFIAGATIAAVAISQRTSVVSGGGVGASTGPLAPALAAAAPIGGSFSAETQAFIVGGTASGSGVQKAYAFARYLASGVLDQNFGSAGSVIVEVEPPEGAALQAMALDSRSGAITAAGAVRLGTGGLPALSVIRLNRNGALDEDFGLVAEAFVEPPATSAVVTSPRDAVIQDGAVFVAGSLSGTSAGNTNPRFMVARFRPDGFVDRQFGRNGVVSTQFATGTRSQVNAVTIDFRGRVICAGRVGEDIGVARFQRDGQPDPTLRGQGRLTTPFTGTSSEARAIRIDSATSERVLVAGSAGRGFASGPTAKKFALVRYLDDGTLDESFGSGGRVRTEIDAAEFGSEILDLCIDPFGRIVAAGYSENQPPIG